MKDGSVKAPVGLTNYWSQDNVESELKIGLKFRMLTIMAMERL